MLLVYRSITGSDRGYKTEVLIIIALFERRCCGSSKDSREQTRREVSKHNSTEKLLQSDKPEAGLEKLEQQFFLSLVFVVSLVGNY